MKLIIFNFIYAQTQIGSPLAFNVPSSTTLIDTISSGYLQCNQDLHFTPTPTNTLLPIIRLQHAKYVFFIDNSNLLWYNVKHQLQKCVLLLNRAVCIYFEYSIQSVYIKSQGCSMIFQGHRKWWTEIDSNSILHMPRNHSYDGPFSWGWLLSRFPFPYRIVEISYNTYVIVVMLTIIITIITSSHHYTLLYSLSLLLATLVFIGTFIWFYL